ncbi:MAG: class I SAM-dependent methyltransferase [Candidatus Bathyarchaeota archaeon]|nr:class I SAM-dependent methyltransferase [Candidatus Bathyarchaeota archaeon]
MGITSENWKQFFFNSNEGQGTLYDRLILHSFFDRFIENNKIQSALDCPSFGMTGFSGINSVYLAKKGINVTVADDDAERLLWTRKLWEKIGMGKAATFVQIDDWSNLPFKDNSFDLVWNLSSLWHIREDQVPGLVSELGRVYSNVLFISIHNAKQLVYPVYKKIDSGFFEIINEQFCKEEYLTNLFKRKLKGAEFSEKGYFVTTPWPGLIIKKEQIFGGSNSENHRRIINIKRMDEMKIPEYIKYLDTNAKNKMKNLMLLEMLPNFVKKYWAHLTYYVFQKNT